MLVAYILKEDGEDLAALYVPIDYKAVDSLRIYLELEII